MLDALLDALIDTLKILPLLFLTYLLMEYLEHHEGGRLARLLSRSRKAGPALGSALGLVPQCGFSGAAANLFSGGAITMGTLVAVFISTSDEMLPILISSKVPAAMVAVILGLKLISGLLVGYIVDFLLHLGKSRHREIHDFCEQEHCDCEGGMLRSAFVHTLKIIGLIFLVTAVLNVAFLYLPRDRMAEVCNIPVVGELMTALLGLMPNCAASVMITNLFVEGVLGLGPMLSGLMANAGVGLLVLFRVNPNRRENLTVLTVLVVSGVLLGLCFDALFADSLCFLKEFSAIATNFADIYCIFG